MRMETLYEIRVGEGVLKLTKAQVEDLYIACEEVLDDAECGDEDWEESENEARERYGA
jgi:hypothetical protein